MIDAFVGTWRGGPGEIIGLQGYLDALGKSDKFSDYNKGYTTVCMKISDNELKNLITIDGSDKPIEERLVIGETSNRFVAGFGLCQVESRMEGSKIVGTFNVEGKQVISTLDVQDNCLIGEITCGNTKSSFKFPRA